MKHLLMLAFTGLLIFMFACSQDIKFSLPEAEPLVAVQALIGSDYNSKVRVTMARGVQEPAMQMDIDCKIDLFEDGLLYQRLILDTPAIVSGSISAKGYLDFPPDSSFALSEGKEYSIEVSYPGYKTVTARDIKPYTVKIREVSWRNINSNWTDWYFNTPTYRSYIAIYGDLPPEIASLIEYTIVFDDVPEVKNFYRIGINEEFYIGIPAPHRFRDYRIQYALYSDPDPPYTAFFYNARYYLDPGSGSLKSTNFAPWTQQPTFEILWNDNDFDGERHSIKIISPRPYEGSKCIISLYSLSEDYYKYMIDRWIYYKTSDDPFAEPVRLHSNTSNGCGIFALYSVDKDTLQF